MFLCISSYMTEARARVRHKDPPQTDRLSQPASRPLVFANPSKARRARAPNSQIGASL